MNCLVFASQYLFCKKLRFLTLQLQKLNLKLLLIYHPFTEMVSVCMYVHVSAMSDNSPVLAMI